MTEHERIAGEAWGHRTPGPSMLPDASEGINKLAAALAKARASIEPITKGKQANAGKYGYSYADLATVVDATTAALSENGLSYVQRCTDREWLETILLHESGQWIAGRTPIVVKGGGPQDFGSGMTYARRYGLLAMLGMAPEDDDGAGAQKARDSQPRRAQRSASTAPRGSRPGVTMVGVRAKELADALKRKRSHGGYQDWLSEHRVEIGQLSAEDQEFLRGQVRAFLAEHPRPEPPSSAGDAWEPPDDEPIPEWEEGAAE